MEILQITKLMSVVMNIWIALTTENQTLINIICSPFLIIETILSMCLFTTVLNISTSKKQNILYVFLAYIFGIISNIYVPSPYSTYINMLVVFLLTYFIFKVSFFKAILAEIIPLIIIVLLETVIIKIYSIFFNISYELIAYIPLTRILSISTIYFVEYLVYKLLKKFNINILILDKISNKNKKMLLLNAIIGFIAIATQFYLAVFYTTSLPFFIVFLSILSLIAYFMISIYSLTKTAKLEITTQNLEVAKLYNQSLIILHDNVRSFKHDFNNIVQAIGGYIDKNDLNGLRKYYSQLLTDCQRVNNLTTLNPETINNPAIYAILASKYLKADELGIQINLTVFLDLNKLNMKIYEFTRILGILIDNAIEASSECSEKIIRVEMRNDIDIKRQLLIIENTYKNKDVDTDKIFEKGYTTKTDTKNPHGLGLWEVRQILKKNNNLNLFTTKNENFFKQQLEIY